MLRNRGKLLIAVISIIVLVISCAILTNIYMPDIKLADIGNFNSKKIVIDAGHGGVDGGAVASDGTKEKDIDLQIATKLKKILTDMGYEVVMTRVKDMGLYENNNSSIRTKKVEDLKNRTELINNENPLLVVSIHLNSFPEQESVCGAQSFYFNGENKEVVNLSKEYAMSIQDSLQREIKFRKERNVMSRKGVYLMEHSKMPFVLVECGFISNHKELELLKSEEYQNKVSVGIANGIKNYRKCK